MILHSKSLEELSACAGNLEALAEDGNAAAAAAAAVARLQLLLAPSPSSSSSSMRSLARRGEILSSPSALSSE